VARRGPGPGSPKASPSKRRGRTSEDGAKRRDAPRNRNGERKAHAGKAARKGQAKTAPARNRKTKTESAPKAPRVSLGERLRARGHQLRQLAVRLRRPALMVGRIALVVSVVAGAFAVGELVQRHLRTSPAFAAETLELRGNDRLDRTEVLKASGLEKGQNVFKVGPEDAEARLERHSWIAEASVTRRLPDTFELEIRERQASALLSIDGSMYLVSQDGTVFKRLGQGDPVDLPVITGIDRKRFVQDRKWRTSILLEIVALLHDYRGAGLWRREPIGEIHVEPDDGLVLYIGQDATLVRLGRGPFRRKLRKLRKVLDRLEQKEARPAYVYLDNVRRPDRVTVKLR
jgi:cell division protein FtsQ